MKKELVFRLFLFLSLVLALPASAGQYCGGGAVTHIALDTNGMVLASIENIGTNQQLCNLKVKDGTWDPPSCRALYAMLLSARLSAQKLALFLADGQNCTRGNYDFLARDAGFYHAVLY